MTIPSPRRGEIWWAIAGTKLRPVLVVSADSMNRRLSKVLVVPGTTNVRGWPDEVLLPSGFLRDATAFCCREVAPLQVADLRDRVGGVPESLLSEVCDTLAKVFACVEHS